jgi:hypothetical protein
MVPLILELGSKWNQVLNLRPRCFTPGEIKSPAPIEWEAG